MIQKRSAKALALKASQDLAPSLPISSQDLLANFSTKRSLALELKHGNGDLIKALKILGIAGPFTVLSPWELEDSEGRHLINAGGYAALPFGEMYPPLIDFIKQYLEKNKEMSLPQQSAASWRAALETNLIHLLAKEASSHADSQVFFSNSGAEAIEAAIKFVKAARPKAKYFINFSSAYHGKTTGALSLTPNQEYQEPFKPLMPGVKTIAYGDIDAFEAMIYHLGPKNITAVVLEPIQGEGGVIHPPESFLSTVQSLCHKHDILIIADEIQTGLGRSGHWFASLAGGLEADIITLAKPLGGGMVPIGATIARKWIVKKALGGLESKRHSSTFGGGSLAMAVGLKSLELLIEENLVERAHQQGELGLEKLKTIQAHYPGYIREVRGAGMLFAVQLRHVLKPYLLPGQKELLRQLGTGLAMRAMHLHGVHVCFTLNSSQVFRLSPALNMPSELFGEMFERIEKASQTYRNAWQMLPKTPVNRLLQLAKLALSKS